VPNCKIRDPNILPAMLRTRLQRCSSFGQVTMQAAEIRNGPKSSIRERENQACAANPYFELSMICCAFLTADSSGALSFFRMSIAFCAEATASCLLPSFA